MPATPRRHFLPWDRPLLPQAVAALAGAWQGPGPLDLSEVLLVVPTRQSGRRFREALADYAAARGSATFPPQVFTPEGLIAGVGGAREAWSPSPEAPPRGDEPGREGRVVASRLEVLLTWIDVLQTIDLGAYRTVFPVDPPARNFSWAMRLGELLGRVQATLAENDLTFAEVSTRLGADFAEADRWRELGELERQFTGRLAAHGRCTPLHGRLGARTEPEWMAAIRRIVIVGTADPIPAAIQWLAQHAAGRSIDVLVFAPEAEAARFDAWGRPIPEHWASAPLNIPSFRERVHLCADAAEQAARIARLASQYATPAKATSDAGLAIGLADPDVLGLLEADAPHEGVGVFNPEGEPRRGGALYHLLAALGACAGPSGFEEVAALARCPEFLRFLQRRLGAGFSPAEFLRGLDDLRQRHLPADLASARRHAAGSLADALACVAEVQRALREGSFPENVAQVLAELFRDRPLAPDAPADAELPDAATAWTTLLREIAELGARFPAMRPEHGWEIALRLFGDSRRTEDKPAGALELLGWLELLFEDAPHLVVAGLNDGLVPEAVSEDPFLPESLRARLGLKTNAARFARDAYLLQAIGACRAGAGRLDLLLGKTSSAGDPLRPSRLLLRCADEELPERIAFLFRSPDAAGSHLPWTRAWRLRPRRTAPPTSVAVTSLRRWLACRFRFYLKYALRMEAVEAAKSEMDGFDFGTLCHAALEAMGGEPALRDCTDAGVLREFLLAQLARHARAKFGADLSLPLLIQVESAKQRLARLAEVQAAERSAGWVIQAVERPFAIAVAGITVKGKIDRIDRHEGTGAVRVIDYKTADTAVAPRAAHIRAVRADEGLPEWAKVLVDGKLRAWADLQLPLYRHALAPEFGPAIAAGYFNLPKAVGETALTLWDDFTPELQESARRCAEGVCEAISRGEFWPPNDSLRAENDEFATLFHRGATESVEWSPP